MTTENKLSVIQSNAKRLDELAATYGGALATSNSPFSSALTLAQAMGDLRELLTEEMMKPIMALMNSPLGFLTDRTGKPRYAGDDKWRPCYTWEQVRDCMIEATLRGFAPVGNEFNIIAERFYGAKAGFRRKVQQFPGLTNFKDSYEVPNISDASALVKCKAQWSLTGEIDFLEREFFVKGDKFAGADSYCGKAERKLLNAVFQRISGVYIPEGDASDFVETPANGAPKDRASAKPAINVEKVAQVTEALEKLDEAPAQEAEVLTEWRDTIKTEIKTKKVEGKPDVQYLLVIVGKNKCFTLGGDLCELAIDAEQKNTEHSAFVRKVDKSWELVELEEAK